MVGVSVSRLKSMRLSLHLSTEYVSNVLGVSTMQLEMFESGELIPEEKHLTLLAEIYGCRPEYLLISSSAPTKDTHYVLARNGDELSDFDLHQVEEFLAFQREISKYVQDTNR